MDSILSIDQSTAGTKGLVWGTDGRLLARHDVPHRQITNEAGWVEHDPMEIWQNTLAAAKGALEKAGVPPESVRVAGISNQRETAVCWDRQTGMPLYNAIVWQCGRARDITDALEAAGCADDIFAATGLPLSPFFSAAKYAWILRHVPAAAQAMQAGRLCCGTIDAWLLYKLCDVFKTDYSNASRTQLLNLDTLQWDEAVCALFGLDVACLPEICPSDSLFGYSDFGGLFPTAIPVHGAMGDSHAALYANHCWQPFSAKVTFGTGSSIMMNAGTGRPKAAGGVATSLAWGAGGQAPYVLEGNVNYTGAVIKWLVEDIDLLGKSAEAGQVASQVSSSGGVYLIPAFSGLSAPYYNNSARAAFLGMNRTTRKAHLVRAAEECIAYQIRDVVEAINACSERPLETLRADGGPTRDSFLMQFVADMLALPLEISHTEELSGAGAAYCAAMAAGVATEAQLYAAARFDTILPRMPNAERDALYAGWKDAVAMLAR